MRTAKFSYAKAIGTRLLAGIPVFLVVTFAATALSNLTPGSAAQLILGENAIAGADRETQCSVRIRSSG